MPVHPVSVIASPALEVLSDDFDGLILVVSVTAVVTGERRAAISPEQVQLYSEAPKAPYQVIALVNASSGNGWSDQQSVDYAVEELKNQAAAVGANGVILGQPDSQTGGFVMSGNVALPYDEQTVSGTAVYVSGE
jgi:hypothetical protein